MEGLELAAFIDDGDGDRRAKLGGLGLCRRQHALDGGQADARLCPTDAAFGDGRLRAEVTEAPAGLFINDAATSVTALKAR